MDAITIASTNYLPQVNILGHSFLNHHHNARFFVLVVDGNVNKFNKNQDFIYLTPKDLNLPAQIIENMALYYTVTEFSTALKPSALKFALDFGSDEILYLDPDIEVFEPLTELTEQFQSASILLTPHCLKPIPRDNLRPSEIDILSSGTFNLGFIGIKKSNDAIEFLDWWEERLRFDALSDPKNMLFTDQRWIDFVPSIFPYSKIDHPGYNVAYWNLHERELSCTEGKFYVDDSPLKFFHYSGFTPEEPWILSKYVSDLPRIKISSNPIYRMIFSEYQKKLNQEKKINLNTNYGYDFFENGERVPLSLRRLYREDCINAKVQGKEFTPPKNWEAWANERSKSSGNLSRILFSLWRSRPDLMRRFPDATGEEAKDFISWAKTHGISEGEISARFLEIGDLADDRYPEKVSFKKGINVAGYLSGELGVGQSSRLIHKAALGSGLPVNALDSTRNISPKLEVSNFTSEPIIYPFTIAVVNADHFNLWFQDLGKKRLAHSVVIGVWAWEISEFPEEMRSALDLVDEIWVVSNFVKDSIKKLTRKKVFVFPTPIEIQNSSDLPTTSEFNVPYNLFVFDYLSVFNRKNPIAVVNAHIKAFPNSDGPKLVIKTLNSDKDAKNSEKLKFATESRADIKIIDSYMTRNELSNLISKCESYVSLHRSEGYGLTMAEAMALGKPVVATGYSGNLEFMNEKNSILIPYEFVPVGNESFPYPKNSYWAEPDLDIAAAQLRKLHLDPNFREYLGKEAKDSVLKNFPLERASKFIYSRFKYYSKPRVRLFFIIRWLFFKLNSKKITGTKLLVKVSRKIFAKI